MSSSRSETSSGDSIRIELLPLGEILSAPHGTSLHDVLFAKGVEFPCGGQGRCRGCRIRVIEGELPLTDAEENLLSREELEAGWRLACRGIVREDLKLDLAQWETPILADDSEFSFSPRDGLGVAVDLGTTTIAAQLIDMRSGKVLGVRTALNSQARHGADIMSRIEHATARNGQEQLKRLVREQVGGLIRELHAVSNESHPPLTEVVLVGNTAMHHFFCDIDITPLAQHPFEPVDGGLKVFHASQLGWELENDCVVRFLPCLGGFVGSDVLVGLLATRIHEQESPQALVDLGTNGEIVVGNREKLLVASTAVGPAFEGARISMGMRAATGAISGVVVQDHKLQCRVQGSVPPRGICGSGLVDAIAAGLELNHIEFSGRLAGADTLVLSPPVQLTQGDIRELQLAKGAIAAGIRILVQQWGEMPGGLSRVYLAGAFGNYINRSSAQRIGLIAFDPDRVYPAGNTALRGAKLALFDDTPDLTSCRDILEMVEHVTLNSDASFQDIFVEELQFPS